MAPTTKGLSMFNLSNKKSVKNVEGNMVVKVDGKPEPAAPADEKAVKRLDAPIAEAKEKGRKSESRTSDGGSANGHKAAAAAKVEKPAAPEPAMKAAAPPTPTISTAAPAAAAAAGKPTPVALPLAAEAAAVAAAKVAMPSPANTPATPKPASVMAPVVPAPATPAKPAAAPPAPALAPAALPKAAPAADKAPAPRAAAAAAAAAQSSGKPRAPEPEPEVAGAKLRAEDARAAWQTRPRVPVRLLDSHVNFMVVGESGLGKTTFIRNLVSSYTKTNRPHDGSTTSLASFQSDPDSLKTVLEPMEVREAGRRVHVTVQDMPGWADDINLVFFLRIMVNFILQQRAKDYDALAGGRALNTAAMCGQLQNSITACVYFLTPHRLKKVDLIMMSALSQLVTVIPVIAKADTMTDNELEEYRQEIRTRLSNPSKFVHNKTLAPLVFSNFTFDDEVMSALGLGHDAWPLAIITSNKQEPISDRSLLAQLGLSQTEVEQPVREYKWGAAYALNREHSDLIILKRMLLGDRVDSLYAMLDASYAKYVAFCDQYEDAGRQLPLVVQDELSAASYLEYDDYSNAKSALDAAQQAMSTLMAENKVLVERLQALERERSSSNGGAAQQRRF